MHKFNMGVIYTHLLSSDNVAGVKLDWTLDEYKKIFDARDNFEFSTVMEDIVLQMFDYSSSYREKEKLQKIALHMDCADKQPRCIFFGTDLDYAIFAVVFYPRETRICRFYYPLNFESDEFVKQVGDQDIESDDESDYGFYERLIEYQTSICTDALKGKHSGWHKDYEDN